jgi:hypothetical protein
MHRIPARALRVIGCVARFHIRDESCSGGRVETESLDPLDRPAGNYTKAGDILDLSVNGL